MDEEQAEEKAALMAEEEEWDWRDALDAVHEDLALDECPDWDLNTHSIDWDIQYGYVQIQCARRELPYTTHIGHHVLSRPHG
jgi:hypothetical protein